MVACRALPGCAALCSSEISFEQVVVASQLAPLIPLLKNVAPKSEVYMEQPSGFSAS